MVLTFFFAQFLGLILLILGVSLLKQRSLYVSMVDAFAENRGSIFGASFAGLMLGIAVVLLHNVWGGGLLPLLVTLIGWMIFLKCVALLTLPSRFIEQLLRKIHSRKLSTSIALIQIAVGAYLFLAGSGGL